VFAAAPILATFATSLRDQDIPSDVRSLARDCLIDTVGAVIAGHDSPVGRALGHYTQDRPAGAAIVLGTETALTAEDAAFANGTLAHALELDSLRAPGAGVHPGAVLVPAALAVAQELGRSGIDLLRALVAGCEVLFRIGRATRHSAEARGFHAPGLTGPFGSATAAGVLLRLDQPAMTDAFGIAGSTSAGLLEFAASGQGGMVKRLHLGRAAAAGIAAARLARSGFTGPETVLEGPRGFLHAFCVEADAAALSAGLGTEWEMRRICFKSFACHITAHTPVYAVRRLAAAHGFTFGDVARVQVAGTPKMAALHANTAPDDLVAAQYSIAYCVAAALHRDPATVDCFTEGLHDPVVRDLCRRVAVTGDGGFASAWATRTTVELRNGTNFVAELTEFPGTPAQPFTPELLRAKFLAVVRPRLGPAAERLHERLSTIEHELDLTWLRAALARSAHVDA
jgi:2-methylcitrate dehydratase PrpD